VKQLPQIAQCFEGRLLLGVTVTVIRGLTTVKIGPASWNQRPCAVGQDQHQTQFALAVCPGEQLKCLSLERMVFADDGYVLGVTVKVVVGSVSSVPSIRFRTPTCCDSWPSGWWIEEYWV
jgi:hypothetical protein